MSQVNFRITIRHKDHNSYISGFGILDGNDLFIPAYSTNKQKPYMRCFQDIAKDSHPILHKPNEFLCPYNEWLTKKFTDKDGKITESEYLQEYSIWYKKLV